METEEGSLHDASFDSRPSMPESESPDRPRRHLRSNVYMADLAASSILDGLSIAEKDHIRLYNENQTPYKSDMGSFIDQQDAIDIEKMQSTLDQSQSRTQIIAATSMSILHVALLKDTLDAGKDGHPYYGWVLGFIITALVLQVFVGLMALYVALLRRYTSNYDGDLGAWITWCCPFSCKRNHSTEIDFEAWIEDCDFEAIKAKSKQEVEHSKHQKCPWRCECSDSENDLDILELYNTWSGRIVHADLQCADINGEMRLLTDTVNKARKELQDLEAIEDEGPVFEEQLNGIRARLERAEESRLKLEERRFNAKKLKSQGEVLRRYVDTIVRKRMLKRTLFWQNSLSIVLYLVFILNAIIVGFGLANKQVEQET